MFKLLARQTKKNVSSEEEISENELTETGHALKKQNIKTTVISIPVGTGRICEIL